MSKASSNTLGRYQIIREIARSNDIVYEAVDPSIGRRVALKELQMPPNLVGGARRERVERFYREAKAAGALSHPNIVTIHEVGEENGRHYIAMEFLEGQNLQDAIEIRGALPAREAVDIAVQMLEALAFAHSRGIIHRDIKPANIQLLPGGRVKLTDFGIARITHEPSITASGQIFGTPSYMSPEQVAGKDIDVRSDLFSMGVVLYEALTGTKPFTGDSVVTITYNIMNTPPPRPQGVPDGLADIVEKALQKDPAMRHQTAESFLDALRGDWQNQAPPPPLFFSPGGSPGPVTSPGWPPPPPGPAGPQPGGAGAPGTSGPSTGAPTGGWLPPPPQQQPQNLPPQLPPLTRQRTPRPILTSGQRTGLLSMFLALALGGVLLFVIYAMNTAYHNYRQMANDKEAIVFVERGQSALLAGEYQKAVEELKKADEMDISPDLRDQVRDGIATAYWQTGQRYMSASNYPQAIEVLNQALSYNPNSGAALFLLGESYARLNSPAQAVEHWERAYTRDPDSEGGQQSKIRLQEYYYGRGQMAYNVGDVSQAIRMWQEVMRIDATNSIGQSAQEQISRALLR